MKERIFDKLSANLTLENIEIIDESHLHRGHNGFDGSPETHFKIIIKAKELVNIPRLASHQKLHQILSQEIQEIHAISFKINK